MKPKVFEVLWVVNDHHGLEYYTVPLAVAFLERSIRLNITFVNSFTGAKMYLDSPLEFHLVVCEGKFLRQAGAAGSDDVEFLANDLARATVTPNRVGVPVIGFSSDLGGFLASLFDRLVRKGEDVESLIKAVTEVLLPE